MSKILSEIIWDDVTETALDVIRLYRAKDGQGLNEADAEKYMVKLGAFFYEVENVETNI